MNKLKPIANPEDDKPKLDDESYRLFANTIIVIGLIFIIIGIVNWPDPTKSTVEAAVSYWTRLGTIGDFTAGVGGTCFTLGGFIYLYMSFKKQRDSNEVQLATFQHEKVENRFFELIRLHRENVNELELTHHTYKFNGYDPEGKPQYLTESHDNKQRQVFHHIVKDFEDAYNELSFLFEGINKQDLYENDYLQKIESNLTIKKREIEPVLLGKMDLVYLIIFFGVGQDGKKTIASLTTQKYKKSFVDQLLAVAALKPTVVSKYWSRWLVLDYIEDNKNHKIQLASEHNIALDFTCLKKKYPTEVNKEHKFYYTRRYIKYYGGHQFRLGHYFRHLFQTVSFINEQADLYGEDQYAYIKHLRGQLSTYEQILIFLNSLSQLGRIWELEDKRTGNAVARKSQLITDYGVIKNIPHNEVIGKTKLTDFYPGIEYEGFQNEQKTT